MENKHTQEPLFWSEKYGEICFRSRADDQSYGMACPVDMEDEANARRIVACVSACAGINTEALEHRVHLLKAEDDQIATLTKQRDELLTDRDTWKSRAEFSYKRRDVLDRRASLAEAQRDELLAALERIAAGPGSNRLSTAIEWAKEAIASVKGGAE